MVRWLGYLAMCVGMFMAILDIQIVASSLPEIQAGLHIPLEALSWVQTAYLIAEIVAIPLTGWLTSLLSLRLLFLIAVTGFTLASIGCAESASFAVMLGFRVIQGFAGGVMIPATFTAIFTLFPQNRQIAATAVGGLLAMAAPMLGPAIGGYITDTWSWPWLFLINVGPGILSVAVAALLLRTAPADRSALERLDLVSLILFAVALSALEIGLKDAPGSGWTGQWPLSLFVVSGLAGTIAIRRCLGRSKPLVEIRLLFRRDFATACFFSFTLGSVLYGSVYLLAVFLGLVRFHTAYETGLTMIVAGAAQFIALPFAAFLVRRVDARLLTGFGFATFALGLAANGFMTFESDYDALFWPQVLRGIGVVFCLLPTTSVALEPYEGAALANASALFNLMRNLGGAIWIALLDTILEGRDSQVAALLRRLHGGDPSAAAFVGLPVEAFHGQRIESLDDISQFVDPLIQRAAAVAAFNQAWFALGGFCVLSLLALPLLKRSSAAPR
ncbi:MAG: transporter, family, multidrug resistance protein [Aliidongia sp.]|nr:transporter, family, multidrug resistance protein [Aliidongia sp.]